MVQIFREIVIFETNEINHFMDKLSLMTFCVSQYFTTICKWASPSLLCSRPLSLPRRHFSKSWTIFRIILAPPCPYLILFWRGKIHSSRRTNTYRQGRNVSGQMGEYQNDSLTFLPFDKTGIRSVIEALLSLSSLFNAPSSASLGHPHIP